MNSIDRRSLFKLVGAGAVAVSVPALAACGTSGTPRDSVANTGKNNVPWPTYQPAVGPTPDLAADPATGLQAGYLNYPTKIVKSMADKPGDGSDVTALIITYGTPPGEAAQNKLWQALNTALGINLKLIMVPDADFVKKMTTMMASNDLPDIIMLGAGYSLPREAEFVQSVCADLSAHLSGDAVKQYPNLANIPGYAWQGMGRIGGKIYGVPIERPMVPGNVLLVNRTMLESVGAKRDWSADEFHAAIKSLTGNNRWGIGTSKQSLAGSSALAYHASSYGAPNQWKLEAGAMKDTWGTDEFKAGLANARALFDEKLYYPDSASVSTVDLKTQFYNQTVAAYNDGFGGFGPAAFTAIADKFTIDVALGYGAKSGSWVGRGQFGYTVVKKAADDRIKLMLRIMNYLAAPFGTKEYELTHFGVEGEHFTRGEKGITQTALFKTENLVNLPVGYLASAPQVLYYAGFPDAVKRAYEWQKAALPRSVKNPANGLRSATETEKGTALKKILTDGWTDILLGRKAVSDWDTIVKDWRTAGGEKVGQEYAAEYAAAQG